MTRYFISLISLLLTLGGFAEDAEARRFGGGRSFGIQRTAPTPKAAPTAPTRSAAPATQPRKSGIFGALAGLAAGLGLAALFAHLGLDPDMATFFLIALLAFGAIMVFRRFAGTGNRPSNRFAYAGRGQPHDATRNRSTAVRDTAGRDALDEAAFVRQAKLNFIRLQAAYDIGNLDDIRAFTTPEVFAEVKMQYDERAGAEQQTDIVALSADVIDVVEDPDRYLVSVRFTGLIREHPDTSPAPFDEIWHLTKLRVGHAGWLVSGIQQHH